MNNGMMVVKTGLNTKPMETSSLFILFVIFLAFVFDFTNGFHDAGNSIATIVATGVLTPLQAVMWAAFLILLPFYSSSWLWPLLSVPDLSILIL